MQVATLIIFGMSPFSKLPNGGPVVDGAHDKKCQLPGTTTSFIYLLRFTVRCARCPVYTVVPDGTAIYLGINPTKEVVGFLVKPKLVGSPLVQNVLRTRYTMKATAWLRKGGRWVWQKWFLH